MMALAVGVALSAFTAPKTSHATSTLYFQFTGDHAQGSDYINPNNWTMTDAEGAGCSVGDLPCVVEADNISGVTDESSFASYLDGLSDNGVSFVTDNTKSSRE